jgi:hypothetical protein
MKPGTRQPREKLGVRDNYKSARSTAFIVIAFSALQLTLTHFISFRGTIWAKSVHQFQNFPDKTGYVALDNHNNLMDITVHFYDSSLIMDPYYFLHIFCTYIKYVILFWVFLKIADLFKDIKEKRIFDDKNIKILRITGFSLITIPFFDHWAIYVMTKYVMGHPELFSKLDLVFPTSLSFFPTHSVAYFLMAQVIYQAVIEIFRQGLALKSENDLTV